MRKDTTIISATFDLMTANRLVTKNHKYSCGVDIDIEKEFKDERADFFFNSPDRQDGELYYALKKLGWLNKKYEAPYYWQVRRDKVIISYTEGDIYINYEKI